MIVTVRADAIEEIQIDKDNDSLEWGRRILHFHVQVRARASRGHITTRTPHVAARGGNT